MFFLISKLFWLVAAPVTFLLLLGTAGVALLLLGYRRSGRVLSVIGVGGLFFTAVVPVGAWVLRPIEDRFPQAPERLDPPPTGIIVLGGSMDEILSAARGRGTIADAGERMTEAVVLARRYPDARIVFTGGSGRLVSKDQSEAPNVRRLWVAMGIPDSRIVTEDKSRNTDENVRFTKELVHPQPGERWVLVTSAFHMPRSVALFRANDWPVIPNPVDFRTRGDSSDYWPNLMVKDNWSRLDVAVREWIGLIAYRLTGRTKTLLPAP